MPTSREAAAAAAATAATDALAGQAAVAAQQAILARQAAAAAAQRAEFAYLAGLPPNRRSVAQNNRLAVFLATALRTQHAGPTALHALSTAVQVVEMARGTTIYRLNDPADSFYVVVDGRVVLYDVKDKDEAEEDDGVVDHLARGDSFGEEDLLTGCRRAHRADVAPETPAILLRVPLELYRKYLQHLHAPDFEDKVAFLAQLEVFRSLPEDTLRKLAPCFTQVELHAKDYLVRQGERAESMYAIASGECSVLVDPNFRPDAPPGSTQVPEVDPKKAMQVCHIGPGNIVGDMTVLANVRRRTASILALTDLVTYKIRRATFIRRVPAIQLEALRQVAEAKLRITERRLHSATTGPGSGVGLGGRRSSTGQPVLLTLRDKILHGHDLRQLSHQHSNPAAPLELRGVRRGSVSGNVEVLLANTLAAAAAAAAATAAVPPPAAPQGASGALPAAAATSVLNMGILNGPSYGGWTGGAPAEARMRFGRGARKSISVQTTNMGPGGGGGAGGADRAGAGRRRVTTSSTVLSGSGPRYQDINFTWGLGPGTLINSLLERPSTAANNRRSPSSAEAIRNLTQSLSTPASMPRGTTFGPAAPTPPPPAVGNSDLGTTANPTSVTSTGNPGGGGGSGGAVVGSPPSLPSQTSLMAVLSATVRQHPPVHYMSVGYGRGASPAALRVASAKAAASVPRWGFSPTDGYGPYGGGSGVTPFLSYGAAAAAAAAAAGIDTSGFSVVGVSVGGSGSSSGGIPSGNGGTSAPPSFGERLSTALLDHAVHGSQGNAQLRPGPIILGPPVGATSQSAPEHQQPQPQQRPSSPSQPPPPPQLQDGQLSPQLPRSQSQAQHPQPHPDLRPQQPSDGGEGARSSLTVDIPSSSLGASGPVVAVQQMVEPGSETRESLRRTCSTTSPSRPPTTDPTTSHPQSHLLAGLGQGYGSPGGSMAWETDTPNSPAGDGSEEDGTGWGRHTPRKQKSMGKARFGRRLVTQNSSVDAMVAEAIVQVYAQDVMIRQALAAGAALAVVEGEAAQLAEVASQLGAVQEAAGEPEARDGGKEKEGGELEEQVANAEEGAEEAAAAEAAEVQAVEPTGLTSETFNADNGEEGAARENVVEEGGSGDGVEESAEQGVERQASSGVAEEGTAEGQHTSLLAEDSGSKTKATEGEDGDDGGNEVASPAPATAEEEANKQPAAAESSPITSPRPPPAEPEEPETKAPDTTDDAPVSPSTAETPAGNPNEAASPEDGDAPESCSVATTDSPTRRRSGAGSSAGGALGTERSTVSVGSAASDASAGARSQPPEAALETPRSGDVPGPNPLAERASRRASREGGAGDPPRGSLSGDQDIIGLTPLLRRLSSTSVSLTGRSATSGVVAPGGFPPLAAAIGGNAAEGGQSLSAGAGDVGEGAGSGAAGIAPRGVLGVNPRVATMGHGYGAVGVPPGRLLSQGRHPSTVQLVLPDAGNASFGRQGGMSPPRRLLSMPTAARPYPYVGPFLSGNKGLHFPPTIASSMSGMGQMGMMMTKQLSSSALAARTGIPLDRATGVEVQVQGMRTIRAQGQGFGVEGHGGVGGGGGTGASGLASGNPLHANRGQLKKGGALYRPPTMPRNGATPHV